MNYRAKPTNWITDFNSSQLLINQADHKNEQNIWIINDLMDIFRIINY